MSESFTAVTDCPKCSAVDIHWVDAPRREPEYTDDPVGISMRSISHLQEMVAIVSGGQPLYDPPGAAVMRICKSCDHRWGMQ